MAPRRRKLRQAPFTRLHPSNDCRGSQATLLGFLTASPVHLTPTPTIALPTLGYGMYPQRRRSKNGALWGPKAASPPTVSGNAPNLRKRRHCSETVENAPKLADWMVGPEGQRFPHKINTLADGSPSRFLRILSYQLANLRTMNEINSWLRDRAASRISGVLSRNRTWRSSIRFQTHVTH